MSPLFLHIESSTTNCSVAISRGQTLLAYKELNQGYTHAEKLPLFVRDCMQEAAINSNDLSAVTIGQGPGSYTGLRIGSSLAKGMAYALNIPLIAIDAMQAMAMHTAQKNAQAEVLVPMIDARRMEVYCRAFDLQGNALNELQALVVEADALSEFAPQKCLLMGDGAPKLKEMLHHANHIQIVEGVYPSALHFLPQAMEKWQKQDFVSVAYFEPLYFKNFVAAKPKSLL